MNFRGARKKRNRISARIDLTALVDVVLQLVLFFMLSSTFVVQSSVQIETPRADGAPKYDERDLSVTLTYGEGGPDNGGRIYINNDEVATWDDLALRLTEEVAQRKDLLLLIRADGRVPTSRTVRVWGIATSVGIERLSVAALPFKEER